MKLAFIGCGTMGEILLESALALPGMTPGAISVVEIDAAKRAELARRYRVRAVADMEPVIPPTDIILCAVKPQQMAGVLSRMRPLLAPRQTIVSIAAGVSMRSIRRQTGALVPVVRAMPNLPLRVGAGITALCASPQAPLRVRSFVRRLFSVRGDVVDLPERLMDAVTAVAGSGPAYVFFLTELLEAAARRLGFSGREASRLAVATVIGAARMLETAGTSASRLREQVTSRGGTTERALDEMRRLNLPHAFIHAVCAARDRARELAAGVEKSSQQ